MTTIFAFLQIAARHPQAMATLHQLWAYITLGATGIVTEEATPLIGGLMAHDHYLHLSTVMLSIAVGTWLTDMGLYYVGRWQGRWAWQRWPRLREWMLRTLKVVRRHPWRASLAVRWAYGLRLTLPIACGAAHIPLPVYTIGSAISCATWAIFYTGIGWAFGETTLIILGHVRRYENYLIALIVLLSVIGFWIVRARHVPDEVVEVLASGDTTEMPTPEGPENAETERDPVERKDRR